MDRALSTRFANMKFICAVLVVLLHSFNAMEPTAGGVLRRFMISGVCSIAVPFFFFASGVFLAVHFDEEKWWKRAVATRLRSLLVPYVIWNVGCQFAMNGFRGGSIVETLGLSMKMPPYNVTWFLRALFLFVLLSPLIRLAVRNTWSFFSILALVAGGIVMLSKGNVVFTGLYDFLLYGFPLEGFLYFMIGCLVSYREWRLFVPSWASVGVCSVMALLLMVAGVLGIRNVLFVLSRPLALVFVCWLARHSLFVMYGDISFASCNDLCT